MSGTIRTPSVLMSTEIVDNTTGQITAARIRDVVETFAGMPTSSKTASYTVTAADRGTVINMNSASATTVTINTGVLTAGQGFGVRQVGAGTVTIAGGAGVTLLSSTGAFATTAQNALLWVTAHSTANTFFIDTSVALA